MNSAQESKEAKASAGTESALPEGDSIRQGAVSTAVAQSVTLVCGTFVGAIVSQALGPVGKGALTAIRTLFQMLLQFGGLGLVRASHIVLGKERCSLAAAAGTFPLLFLMGMVLAVLVTVSILAVGAPWLENMLSVAGEGSGPLEGRLASYSGHTPILLLGLLTCAGGLAHVLRGLLQGIAKISWMNTTAIVASLGSVLFLGLLATMGELTLVRAVWVLILANLLQAIMALRWLLSLLHEKPILDWGLALSTLRFGVPLWIGEIGRFLFIRVDLLIVGASLGNAELGPYSVAYALMEMSWFFPRALGVASYRGITGADAEGGLAMTRQVNQLSAVAATLGSVLIGLGAWPFVRVLYGVDFLGAVAIYFVLIPGALVRAGVGCYESFLQGTLAKPAWDTAMQLLGCVLKIGYSLLFLHVWQLGIFGVALGSTLANLSYSLLLVLFMSRLTGRSLAWLALPERAAWVTAFDRLLQVRSELQRRLWRLRSHGDPEAPKLHVVLSEKGDERTAQVLDMLAENSLAAQGFEELGLGPRSLLAALRSSCPGTVLIALGGRAGELALDTAQLLPGLRVLLVDQGGGSPRRKGLLAEANEQRRMRGASMFFVEDDRQRQQLLETPGIEARRCWVYGEGQLAESLCRALTAGD
ncbi:MAG: hypothetical protein CSA62_04155 [Planctomycetota bacterium]|nr:MAG: hypothetical protein CSA62_04155 [Planctomycetota bacterium]